MSLRRPKRCLIENDKFLQKRAGELTIAQLIGTLANIDKNDSDCHSKVHF